MQLSISLGAVGDDRAPPDHGHEGIVRALAIAVAPPDVARGKVSLSELSSDGDSLYWLESRPAEGGPGGPRPGGTGGPVATPPADGEHPQPCPRVWGRGARLPGSGPFPRRGPVATLIIRTSGFGSATVCVWDQCPSAQPPAPVAREGGHRHGGLSASDDEPWAPSVPRPHREGWASTHAGRWSWCCRRTGAEQGEVTLLEGHGLMAHRGADAALARLAVVVWDHPNMPGDASRLLVVLPPPLSRQDGGFGHLGGGPRGLLQEVPTNRWASPVGARDGTLRFVSDRRGWWQPYAHPGHPATPSG